VFDRHPDLRILLAHSGGCLPQLSSRLSSCIKHDPVVASRLKHDARYYVSKLYFDAVNYGAEGAYICIIPTHTSFPNSVAEMGFVADVIGRGPAFATAGGLRNDRASGYRRMLFGTDHPFFPPLEGSNGEQQWQSVVDNLQAIDSVKGWGERRRKQLGASMQLNSSHLETRSLNNQLVFRNM
jgi:aminocarboxymuconate-semialdehyde decarboxylase